MAETNPDSLLRLPQIIGNKRANPPLPALIPVSKSTWWAGVNSGRYPKPVKIGPRLSAWRASDIQAFIASGEDKGASTSQRTEA